MVQEKCDDRLYGTTFVTGGCDEIEIVGVPGSIPDQVKSAIGEDAKRSPRGAIERGKRNEPAIVLDLEDVESLPRTIAGPPRHGPFPRQEDRIARAFLKQVGPFGPQLFKRWFGLDRCHSKHAC